MSAIALVALGGALGSGLRYLLTIFIPGHVSWSILVANISGSFGLGLLIPWASPGVLLFAGVGFCGALTTFSTFALDTLVLAREGRRAVSGAHVAVSVAGSVLAFLAGLALAGAALT